MEGSSRGVLGEIRLLVEICGKALGVFCFGTLEEMDDSRLKRRWMGMIYVAVKYKKFRIQAHCQ